MFLVVGHQVCTHLRRDFFPLLSADPLQVIKVSRLTFDHSNLQLPPQIFYGIKVWRLARPLQDLNVLLLEPLLCCLGVFVASSPLNHWDTSDGPVYVLSWAGGIWGHCKMSVLHGVSLLPIVFLVTMVPAALRSLPRSSRVVPGWYLTVLMTIKTSRGEILHEAPDRGRWQLFCVSSICE